MSYAVASGGMHVAHATLVEILFDVPLRAFNGIGELEFDENIYTGAGDLGEISEITGGDDLEAADVRLTLSGVPSDYRAYLLNTIARGKEVNIYSGFWDEDVGEWSDGGEPELDYAGFIDSSQLTEALDEKGGVSISVEVTCISAAAFARRFTIARRTAAHQKAMFDGDEFYSFLTDQRAAIPHPRGSIATPGLLGLGMDVLRGPR